MIGGKHMKKLLVPLLAFIFCILLFAAPDMVSAEDDPLPDGIVQSGQLDQLDYDGQPLSTIYWSLDSENTMRIWGDNVRYEPENILASDQQRQEFRAAASLATKAIVEEGITAIGDNEEGGGLFDKYFTQLTEVSLPYSLQRIDGFNECPLLSKISFLNGSSATMIGMYAFRNCSSLKSFTIPESVTFLGDGAFRGTQIRELTIPATCTYVSEWFLQGSSIEEVTWNRPVFEALSGPSLKTIYFGKGLTKINSVNSLSGCTNLSSVIFLGSYDYNSKVFSSLSDVVIYRKNGSSSVTLEEATAGTKNITIPSEVGNYKVTKIGNYAFDGNKYVRTVTVPATVTAVGNYAFYNCSKLNKLTLKNGLKTIGKFAFYGCNSLESLKLPSTVTSIGERAFWNCYSLRSLGLPASVQTIGANAFESCTGLTSVNIGNETTAQVILQHVMTPVYAATAKATKVKGNAFKNCKRLKTVTIGSRVDYIGANAFRGCKNLKTIKIRTKKLTAKKIGSSAFKGIYKKATFKITSKKLKAYKKILLKKGATKKMKFKKL